MKQNILRSEFQQYGVSGYRLRLYKDLPSSIFFTTHLPLFFLAPISHAHLPNFWNISPILHLFLSPSPILFLSLISHLQTTLSYGYSSPQLWVPTVQIKSEDTVSL